MLPAEIQCGKYTSGDKSIDAVSCSASIKDGIVSITICNLDPVNAQEIAFDVHGFKATRVSGKIVTASKINAYNDFGKKDEVGLAEYKGAKVANGQLKATLPAKSVVLIQLQ